MARPKKIKDNSKSVFTMNFEKQIADAPVTRCRNGQWVSFGKDNKYPYHLLGLYNTSPTLRACINFAVQAVIGDGIDWNAMQIDGGQIRPNYQYSWPDFIRRISLDYFLYGSYAFQIIKNRDNKTYSFYHVPIDSLRCSPRDKDGVITSWWISNDWTATGATPPVEVESFIMRSDREYNVPMGKPYVYVYESYQPSVNYYYQPCWASSLKAVQAEGEFLNYDLRMAANCFVPSGSLSLPYMDTDEQKRAMIDEVNKMFVGTSNANSILISFRNDSDDSPVKFEPFASSNENVDLFAESDYRNTSRILSAFQIPTRNLVGLTEKSTGLASQGQMLQTAFNAYMTLTGKNNRDVILGTINEMFKMNGIDVEISVKELSFLDNEGETKSDTPDTQEAPEKSQDITEDNIEEQES